MKVGNINSVLFRSGNADKKANTPQISHVQINEIQNVTPDYKINIPQRYTKSGIIKLQNGLEIHQYKLNNGYKVSIVPMKDSPAVVKNYVNVGSMNETQNIKGISHFLEHMAFNGTNGENNHIKLETGDSFKLIDEIGGWANASTNYAITDYVNSTPLLNKKDLEQQIKVIAAMTEDLKLSEEMIEKEKYPVCSEINMILDDPQTIALDQTVRTLFNIKNPADELVGGSVKHIKNLTRDDVVNYYNTYYTPDNMNLVITGDVNPNEVIEIVSKSFNSKKLSKGKKFEEKLTPIQKTVRKDFINDKTKSCDIVLGFAGPKNNDAKEKVIYEVAKNYLLSYSVGLKQDLKGFNAYPGIHSEKISTNPNANKMVYLGVNSTEQNCEKVLATIFEKISNVKKPDESVLNSIKQKLLMSQEKAWEYSDLTNNIVGSSILNNTLDSLTDYNKMLESVTAEDVLSGIKKYFDLNKSAITVVHPKPQENVNFKGNRKPINSESVENFKTKNNYDIGFYKTKSNNLTYNVALFCDKPYNKKPGVIDVLNEIYSMGAANLSD